MTVPLSRIYIVGMMLGKVFRAAAAAAIFAGLTCAANAQTKVACVGNSITEGYGLGWQENYPFQLQKLLGESYAVTNFGVSGMTFANRGPNDNMSYWSTDKFKAALASSPDIVVIELGTNDSKFFSNNCIGTDGQPTYNYNYGQYEKDQLYKDYEALIDTFAHLPTNPRIIATLQPYSNNCGWGIMDTAIVNQINPIIKDVATKKGVEIIDLHTEFNTPAWFLPDSVHPNATGAIELAKIIEKYILADTAGAASDSAGTTAIRRNIPEKNARIDDARLYDMQGRQVPAARKPRSRNMQNPYSTVKKNAR